MRIIFASLLAVVECVIALALCAGATAAPSPPAVMAIPTRFDDPNAPYQVLHAPRAFRIASADSTLHVRHLRWTGWGTQHARAVGQAQWCDGRCGSDWQSYRMRLANLARGEHCATKRWYETVRSKLASGSWTDLQPAICV